MILYYFICKYLYSYLHWSLNKSFVTSQLTKTKWLIRYLWLKTKVLLFISLIYVRHLYTAIWSQYGMLKAHMINFILMIFCWLEAMLTNRLSRKSTSKKKIQIKAWQRILQALAWHVGNSPCLHYHFCKSRKRRLGWAMKSPP